MSGGRGCRPHGPSVLGTVPGVSPTLSHLTLAVAPRGRHCCHCHFADQEASSEVRSLPRSHCWGRAEPGHTPESSDPEATS